MSNPLIKKICNFLEPLKKVLIAYSGGVDSATLATLAIRTPGLEVQAILADSPTIPRSELKDAIDFAHQYAIPLSILPFSYKEEPLLLNNPLNRCYLCKKRLFGKFRTLADSLRIQWFLDGQNLDDQSAYRPGQQAAKELGVRSPFAELGISKQEIRQIALELGLGLWNKPSLSCLATRIPYGDSVTDEKLKMIETAEDFLRRDKKLKNVRVRHRISQEGHAHAKIELGKEDLAQVENVPDLQKEILEFIHHLGYQKVTF